MSGRCWGQLVLNNAHVGVAGRSMTYRAGLLASSVLLGLAGLIPSQARADLIGPGTTVQAFFYNGVFTGPVGLIPDGTASSSPIALTAPVAFTNNLSGADINVGATQIVITNKLSGAPFCFPVGNAGTACTDQIDGFDFKFTGE